MSEEYGLVVPRYYTAGTRSRDRAMGRDRARRIARGRVSRPARDRSPPVPSLLHELGMSARPTFTVAGLALAAGLLWPFVWPAHGAYHPCTRRHCRASIA